MVKLRGFAVAQNNLGFMYANGDGVQQDYAKAHMWFNLAAAQGDIAASMALYEIAKRMTPDQVADTEVVSRDVL